MLQTLRITEPEHAALRAAFSAPLMLEPERIPPAIAADAIVKAFALSNAIGDQSLSSSGAHQTTCIATWTAGAGSDC
ncbi:MAG: hypothetical protein ABL961_16040 [Vicinamibacterales bacterium]